MYFYDIIIKILENSIIFYGNVFKNNFVFGLNIDSL